MATVSHIDHTADVGIRVSAPSAAEAFVAAAEGMVDIMVDRTEVAERETWSIELEATAWDDLLVAWLEELLYRYETERLIPKRIELGRLSPDRLAGELHGEHLDPQRHDTGVQIKAVTYHQLRAEETEAGFEIQVIFDI